MKNCCQHTSDDLRCKRKSDNKIFQLPRKYSRSKCISTKIKGFTLRASCAPYKNCKRFLFNPHDPKRSYDVYINKNPKNTIPIKYKTITNVKNTIIKLEKLYKQGEYSHKRIKQVAMIMMVRLRVLQDIKNEHYKLAKKYHDFLSKRTKTNINKRMELVFHV